MILVNFKTYKEASGERARSLANLICDIAEESGVEIISVPQAVDLKEVVGVSDHPVWVQHTDFWEQGQSTGWFPPEVAKEAGAQGTFLNHSEHKLSERELGKIVARCKEAGLKILIFADNLSEAKEVAKLKPDFLGYEPPELIASPTTSVARAKPDIIENVVKTVPNIPIIVGAGIKDRQDVEVSLRLGAKGVGVSSAVILSDDPSRVLRDLAGGFK